MAEYHCMLAKTYDPAKVKSWPVLVEPKMDGVRVLVRFTPDGEVGFFSRAMKPFSSFDHLIPAIKKGIGGRPEPKVFILDCEAVSETFNKAVSQVRRKDTACTDVTLFAFDGFTEGEGNSVLYRARRKGLIEVVHNTDVFTTIEAAECQSDSEVKWWYERYRAAGHEGAMVKDPNAPYELKRSLAWMKIKDKLSIDVPVIGTYPGKGKHEGRLGGLIVDVNGVECRVGTGLTDKQREDFQDAWDEDCWREEQLLGPLMRRGIKGRLIEVEYHEMTPAGSLRHPRFIRFRDDKQEAAND